MSMRFQVIVQLFFRCQCNFTHHMDCTGLPEGGAMCHNGSFTCNDAHNCCQPGPLFTHTGIQRVHIIVE
jgi:hypothetical protein